MDSRYRIAETSRLITPCLVLFREVLEENLATMIRIAGDVSRLRPHCKTHKMPRVTRIELEHGITKHKCATFAEAEMLAEAGVRDIFLAYNLVGPNITRAVRFVEEYPDATFSVTADHPRPIGQLGEAMRDAGRTIDVVLDLDTGQHRTGVEIGEPAKQLYRLIARTSGLRPGGLHVYDGQNHQTPREERAAAVNAIWERVVAFRADLEREDLPVPRIIAGGTGSFPIFAEKRDPALELSPGTCVFQDANYSRMFPDLEFQPALLLLTRVVSRPTPDRVTFDLGYKAVASDPPAGKRLVFPDLPDAEQVLQNEEHLVVRTPRASEFSPGEELLAVPCHVCPTTALHRQVSVVSHGEVLDEWDVIARDRRLTI